MSVYQRENGPPAFVVPPSSPVAGTQAARAHFNHTSQHTHRLIMACRHPEGAILLVEKSIRERRDGIHYKL